MEQTFLSDFEDKESGMERKIQEIASLNLKPGVRAQLILVLLGEIKGENVIFREEDDQPEEAAQILVNQCGLYMERMKRRRTYGNINEYAIALDKETAKKLSELDPGYDKEEVGRILGYPESAVKAFCGDKLLDKKDYPAMEGIIFNFGLSEKNWQKEVEVLKKWSDLIKENAPGLYEEILKKRGNEKK